MSHQTSFDTSQEEEEPADPTAAPKPDHRKSIFASAIDKVSRRSMTRSRSSKSSEASHLTALALSRSASLFGGLVPKKMRKGSNSIRERSTSRLSESTVPLLPTFTSMSRIGRDSNEIEQRRLMMPLQPPLPHSKTINSLTLSSSSSSIDRYSRRTPNLGTRSVKTPHQSPLTHISIKTPRTQIRYSSSTRGGTAIPVRPHRALSKIDPETTASFGSPRKPPTTMRRQTIASDWKPNGKPNGVERGTSTRKRRDSGYATSTTSRMGSTTSTHRILTPEFRKRTASHSTKRSALPPPTTHHPIFHEQRPRETTPITTQGRHIKVVATPTTGRRSRIPTPIRPARQSNSFATLSAPRSPFPETMGLSRLSFGHKQFIHTSTSRGLSAQKLVEHSPSVWPVSPQSDSEAPSSESEDLTEAIQRELFRKSSPISTQDYLNCVTSPHTPPIQFPRDRASLFTENILCETPYDPVGMVTRAQPANWWLGRFNGMSDRLRTSEIEERAALACGDPGDANHSSNTGLFDDTLRTRHIMDMLEALCGTDAATDSLRAFKKEYETVMRDGPIKKARKVGSSFFGSGEVKGKVTVFERLGMRKKSKSQF